MPSPAASAKLRELKDEIESFIRAQNHPVIAEDSIELFDLSAASWRLTIEFGKLLLEVWNPARSIARRVEEVAYRDGRRLGLFVRKGGGKATTTIELREMKFANRVVPEKVRATCQNQLLAMLGKEFPGWKFERVSHRSDRAHTFSAHYTRGLARRGTSAWAFIGLSPDEPVAAAEALLAHGVIWLDWLRGRAERFTASGLKLFVPRAAVEFVAHRAAYLNPRTVQIEIHEWKPGEAKPARVDLKDFGNVATRLAPRRQAEEMFERHAPILRELLGDLFPHVEIVPSAAASVLSVRVLGLEVARVEGLLAPRVFFGLEGGFRRLDSGDRQEFLDFLATILDTRRADSPDKTHKYYRLQSERWLESLLVRDIARVDPALRQDLVYPQVPAFAGQDRGVIDLLGITMSGRLAVIELKVDEDTNLPFQGLDYWLRVRWLQERGEFQESGYFQGLELSPEPPLLYLVSPAFRFHSSSDQLLRYLAPSLEVIKVGVNQQWRKGVEVLFRKAARDPSPVDVHHSK